MTGLDFVCGLIESARSYTNDLLNHIEEADWFRYPPGGVTHIGWQVGHLAVAEYRLALVRVRGVLESDEDLIPQTYVELFGKGSVPVDDPARYPAPGEIRAVFDRVHQQTLKETRSLDPAVLEEPTGEPAHPMFSDKLGALRWCAMHEMLHAGQIGLLRRMLGAEPLR